MSVIFIGPLPPPAGGFSIATERMYHALCERYTVLLANRSPLILNQSKWKGKWLTYWRWVHAVMASNYWAVLNKDSRVYLALSGGLGQFVDLLCILTASIARRPIFIHHHSFGYINKRSVLARLLFWTAGKRAVHIVLCEDMGEQLSAAYSLHKDSIRVLNNAFVLNFLAGASKDSIDRGSELVVGFLSNITIDKGIDTFLETIARLKSVGIPVRGRVAGPADKRSIEIIQSGIERGIIEASDYLGAVYDQQKIDYLLSLDVFVLPSRYHNEALPLVLLEAMHFGSMTLATHRGCCKSLLNGCRYSSTLPESDFADMACRTIIDHWYGPGPGPSDRSVSPATRKKISSDCKADAEKILNTASLQLVEIVNKIGTCTKC